jgi:hypothetical protein
MSKPIEIEQLRELLTTIKASLLLSLDPLAPAPDAMQHAKGDQHH